MGLFLLHHKAMSDEWYVDGIAVDKDMRCNKIGTALLYYLEIMAKEMVYEKFLLMSYIQTRKQSSFIVD